jgi:5-(carboxyamino)imidazole ribonucleotide mutase/phosphoribosylaminoimidazole-succinocarboxamide synthase
MKPLVPIIMGSKSDLKHGSAISEALSGYGIDSEIRVASAHKAASYLLDLLAAYEADERPKVYITVAGRSNALSGLVDGNVRSPVIACPPYSDRFGGADIFSSLRMPSGIAPAVILDPGGAALAAAKILGIGDADVRSAVAAAQKAWTETIINDDSEVTQER